MISMTEKLIIRTDPQPEVRKNAENASDWAYKDEAALLYRRAVLFKERFLDPILLTDRGRLPDPVISFDNLRNYRVLAGYRLVRNPQGLLYEIAFNTEQYEDVEGKKVWRYGEWAQMETLLHEQIHLWQQNFGKDPIKPGKAYHNLEFVTKCESLGLHPKVGEGYHLKLADGTFALLMTELGIKPPEELELLPPDFDIDWFKKLLDFLDKKPKGRSSLTKWECPECGLKLRVGIKGDPKVIHHPCSEKKSEPVFFVRAVAMLGIKEEP